MNSGLLDPFQHSDIPEIIEEYLDHGITRCISFNRRGTLLAAGCQDGSVVIWDFDTRGTSRVWTHGHSESVTAVSWTKCGRYLLSASADASLVRWDVLKGEVEKRVQLPAPVTGAQIHPYDPALCLASLAYPHPPHLVNLNTAAFHTIPVCTSVDSRECGLASLVSAQGADKEGSKPVGTGKSGGGQGMTSLATLAFTNRGDIIFIGSTKGTITILDTNTKQVVEVVKVTGGSAVKSLTCSRNGSHLLVNSADRIIRAFDVKPNKTTTQPPDGLSSSLLRPAREFQNAVNRLQWRSVCFSPDAEHVLAASANKNEHSLHCWSRVLGTLGNILEGPPEGIVDMAWHPCRPMIASVSFSGKIYLWAKSYTENWSAFAPDFKELQENQEYVEREDEFDLVEDGEAERGGCGGAGAGGGDEDAEVDVDTVTRRGGYYSDSDVSEEGLHFLPTIPEPQDEDDERSNGKFANGTITAVHLEGLGTDFEAGKTEDYGVLPEGSKRRRVPKKLD